jgi:hypothetical protein
MNAMKLGALIELARLKFGSLEWERYALTGKKNADALRDGAARSNKSRSQDRADVWRQWNCEAKKIWSAKPDLTKASVAELVKKRLELRESSDTIARRLKKVGKAR